jgi:hypothetical protein
MHIHPNPMSLNPANSWSPAADRAAATQKAADLRRKLMKSASDIEGIPSPDEAYRVDRLTDPLHGQSFSDDEYRPGNSGRISDFD